MNFLKFIALIISLVVQSGPVFADWSWASGRMLVADGISRYADRFEILPTDFCLGIKMRAWAKVGDKASNQLRSGDFIEMKFSLGDTLVLNKAQVLSVLYDFDQDFDILYLNFGEWDWSFGERFTQDPNEALFAIYSDGKAEIDSNTWEIGSLSDELKTLK
jgi:hypothetical protein